MESKNPYLRYFVLLISYQSTSSCQYFQVWGILLQIGIKRYRPRTGTLYKSIPKWIVDLVKAETDCSGNLLKSHLLASTKTRSLHTEISRQNNKLHKKEFLGKTYEVKSQQRKVLFMKKSFFSCKFYISSIMLEPKSLYVLNRRRPASIPWSCNINAASLAGALPNIGIGIVNILVCPIFGLTPL